MSDDKLRTGVGTTHPVKADCQPPFPSSSQQAAASPVPDSPRDGITLADDDGDSLVFDVHLVMHVQTPSEDGQRTWREATLTCGGSTPSARVSARPYRIEGRLALQLVEAIESYIAEQTVGRPE